MELTWKQRYDALKKHYNLKDADIADITGHRIPDIRHLVNVQDREFPRWLRLAIVIFETNQNQQATAKSDVKHRQPAMLRSHYNRMMYQLNDGRHTSSSILQEVPLRGSEGLPGRFVSVFFARKKSGFWWLDTPVTLIEDESPQEPPFHPVAHQSFFRTSQVVIGLKTLWAGDHALLCRILRDDEQNEYRFQTVSKPDLQHRWLKDDRRLSMKEFAQNEGERLQETFRQIEKHFVQSLFAPS